jgi:hypothetical protein
MQACIVCRKAISGDHELCDEHRNILISVFDAYNKDPEVRGRWNQILELLKSKGYIWAETSDSDVFEFIDEIKSEIAQGK